jgi:transcriptional regulator
LRGRATVHDDPEWLRQHVTTLTDLHEHDRFDPWHVTDAPSRFIESQLRGIVGITFRVQRVEGKAKLSQNRSQADQQGDIHGLEREPACDAAAIAEAMRRGQRDN